MDKDTRQPASSGGIGWIWAGNLILLILVQGLIYALALRPSFMQSVFPGFFSGQTPLMPPAGWLMAGVALVWLIITTGQHLLLKRSRAKDPLKSPASRKAQDPAAASAAVDPKAREKQQHHDRRLFLHLLSVLQKEGRLLDFFQEPLDQYEDQQIGAAVRGVHENCNQALQKYLSLAAVMAESEGDTVTIAGEFDTGTIQLSGNVAGQPPFTGTLKHKGWRAERLNLPKFTFSGDPEVISPAEVEVL